MLSEPYHRIGRSEMFFTLKKLSNSSGQRIHLRFSGQVYFSSFQMTVLFHFASYSQVLKRMAVLSGTSSSYIKTLYVLYKERAFGGRWCDQQGALSILSSRCKGADSVNYIWDNTQSCSTQPLWVSLKMCNLSPWDLWKKWRPVNNSPSAYIFAP